MPYKLAISMIPRRLWGENLRKVLTRSRWDKIRQGKITECGLKCETCGKIERESKRISAHEEWEYTTNGQSGVALLVGVRLACWLCHSVEHFGGRENMVANGELPERAIEDIIKHFCRVNGVQRKAFEQHWIESREEGLRLAAIADWRTDYGSYQVEVEERNRAATERKADAEHQAVVASLGVDFDGDGPQVRKRSGDRAGQKRRYRERQRTKAVAAT